LKIAIIKLSALGDIVHTMVALEYLKHYKPTLQIDWIVEEGFSDILKNNPHIDNILTLNLKSLKHNKLNIFTQIFKVRSYAKNNYDLVIDAQGLTKSAIVAWLLGKNRVGFDKYSIREKVATCFYTQSISIGYEQNVIRRNVKVICEPLGIFLDNKALLDKKSFLYFKKGIENQDKEAKVLFVVGASKPNKIYPKESFLKVAQLLGKRVLVVWGNVQEYEIALWLSQQSDLIELDIKGDLESLKVKISNASLVIGGDTGPTHMAWGLNVPSITIFGNTPEYRNTFITPINRVIKSSSKVNPLKLDKNDFSINEINAQDIVNMAKELLDD
jgi:heptosyltransferase-1